MLSTTAIVKEFAGHNCIILFNHEKEVADKKFFQKVLAEVEGKLRVDPNDHLIVYRDPTGFWNGWDNKTGEIIELICGNEYHAIRRYVKRFLPKNDEQ